MYKVAGLARDLTQAGADVHVVMTPSAMNFVGPITFSTLTGNPVRSELFPATAPTEIPHTDLGRTSDLVLIAPATAKTIAKSAQGVSDDLISALLLSAACPIVMVPAMHTEMWQNEATQQNVTTLVARGIRMVGPVVGALAGPDVGAGRMAELADILQAADEELGRRVQLAGCSVVVTAAGTREPIDAMRFIGNASSGRMGYELAFEAVRRGAQVTLITGPTHLTPPDAATVVRVTTAAEMRDAVLKAVPSASVLVMAAAVSDWRSAWTSATKLKKSSGPPKLELESTPDILAEVGETRRSGGLPELKVLVGYCAETEDLEKAAARKLEAQVPRHGCGQPGGNRGLGRWAAHTARPDPGSGRQAGRPGPVEQEAAGHAGSGRYRRAAERRTSCSLAGWIVCRALYSHPFALPRFRR